MDVSFIVPVSDPPDRAQACLASLQATVASIDYEVILVTDGSDKATVAGLRRLESEHVKLIEQEEPKGFAHTANLGVAQARGQTLVLIRNGLTFEAGWLTPLLHVLDREEKAGLVSSTHFDPSEAQPNGSKARRLQLGSLSLPTSRGFRLRCRARGYRMLTVATAPCIAISRELFNRIGGFDEAYRAGCETLDLSLRLRTAGYACYCSCKSATRSAGMDKPQPDPLAKARDERYFQRKWQAALLELAASGWPRSYLADLLRGKTAVRSDLLREALPRWVGGGPSLAPTAAKIVRAQMRCNEHRWARLIEGRTHSEIRAEQCKSDGNWRSERISYDGAYQAQGKRHGVWLKESAQIKCPIGLAAESLSIVGEIHSADRRESTGEIGLRITINDAQPLTRFPLLPGSFSIRVESPVLAPDGQNQIRVQLVGAARTNLYAFLGRKLEKFPLVPKTWRRRLQVYRPQRLNQRLCLHSVILDDEPLLDFRAHPSSPQRFESAGGSSNWGLNLVGWHTAELGVGESARSAAKALRASKISHALVPLKANCNANKGDTSLSHLLQKDNPYPINVFHIDTPQSRDIDASHGNAFRQGKYNIAYWAWELPEFPDAWIENFKYYDEIWAPSEFAREAIAAKSPLPVVTIPHCIDFTIPSQDYRSLLNLPSDRFLFCFAYDLNSHQSRKNPQAVIEAYRTAFLSGDRRNDAGLIVKTQSRERNPEEYAKLLAAIEGLPHCYLIDKTLPRETVYGLMQACDAYISLHRSEGFGLTVAESMFLGKPVLSTNWSATSEFLDAQNGCPVDYRLVELTETYGPYAKGQIWADPIVEDAAQKMLKLVDDSGFAATIGQNAARTVRQRFSPQTVAQRYESRLKAMRAW